MTFIELKMTYIKELQLSKVKMTYTEGFDGYQGLKATKK